MNSQKVTTILTIIMAIQINLQNMKTVIENIMTIILLPMDMKRYFRMNLLEKCFAMKIKNFGNKTSKQ